MVKLEKTYTQGKTHKAGENTHALGTERVRGNYLFWGDSVGWRVEAGRERVGGSREGEGWEEDGGGGSLALRMVCALRRLSA